MTKTMTEQEVFDIVSAHLHTQGEQAMNGRSCQYRMVKNDGKVLSCGIGCLISDKDYNKMSSADNSASVSELFEADVYNGLFLNFRETSLLLLVQLQAVHDNEDNWESVYIMDYSLQSVATMFNLNYTKYTTKNSNIGKIAR